MKIVPKLTLALIAGTCVILSANGYVRVGREVRFFEADRLRDHEMIGRALCASATSVWKAEGEGPALASVDATQQPGIQESRQQAGQDGDSRADGVSALRGGPLQLGPVKTDTDFQPNSS